ncbi:hypothetical protein KDJ56_07845 [Brevibacillus composti]|uniref:Fur-regulated basic protein FbpA n=1 Tax=Brevibacillus composti TaxID=2796470 RepID=A0A7T5JQ72_9BACL|nr:hypothetical protein [Brevibacillus composti]QQE75826.1 hypothetical protein JD108_08165 [Brevibacillus composti]QUO42852.1 hypothetical protein KDJ56_07845 [Brevibacillus composti]
MTEQEWSLLARLGYRLEDGKVKHLKLGIVLEVEDFSGFDSLSALEAYAKERLRTHCLLKQKKRNSSE